ncbi:MAG: sarcosine oxidase subunit delta [Pseudomonadota bacterium]
MRINCPICGERDRREFYYAGHSTLLNRPDASADETVWDDYMHNRENPCGETRDLWHHEMGCGAWIVVTRNTVTHEILSVELAEEARS